MSESKNPSSGINSWLEDELYQQYLHDRKTVDESWKKVFEANGVTKPALETPVASAVAAPAHHVINGEQLVPLRGAAASIAQNMTASLTIPVATSQRAIPVKVIDENRRLLNEYRTLLGKSKISYTHLIGWAIVKALAGNPALNHAYAFTDGAGFRAVRAQVNLGIAVDVAAKDGTRSLKVPSVKNASGLSFEQYVAAFDDIVARARNGKLTLADFEGTTISLTNPGTVGTLGSVPRLMPGQGAIIATGAIDFPAEYQGASDEVRTSLGLSKVMMVTCTYDHRVIQGAESGMFLGRLQALLLGEDGFYEEVFSNLHTPFRPVRWEADRGAHGSSAGQRHQLDSSKQAAVIQLIRAYRVRGHLMADVNPLRTAEIVQHPELDPATYGLTLWDLDREFQTGSLRLNGHAGEAVTLREILETIRQTYCGRIACEYMHIQYPEERRWLADRMEPLKNRSPLDAAEQIRALERVIEAEEFEHFLHTKFIGHKRFSLEGAESAIVILDELLERAANTNVHEIVIGMAHRGRLNVLANIVGKSMVQVFSEFEGNVDPESTQGSGDVKYHLGATGTRTSTLGKEIVVSVTFNPSHLEAVDPVVEGIVRPKQDRLGDVERERVIPILIHGDAAFAGQGVVAETLNLSQLDGYRTGGTIHLVINNQIGFTTNPQAARSSSYSTDVARMVQAPIFHVNGDDPKACMRVAQMAYDFRQQFKKDVVIDMVCYRRHGHNEADDPSYTQPIMYRKIRQLPSVAVQYAERLVRERTVTVDGVIEMRRAVTGRLNAIYDASRLKAETYVVQELSTVDLQAVEPPDPNTAISLSTIERVVGGITSFPPTFQVHPKLKGFIDKRKEVLNGAPIDWAAGEALAFGSLLVEGIPVRLSGQDSGRGTFSQRHLEFYDYETGEVHIPMQHIALAQARFDVYDSLLSEYAVMGFEFGYSVADPLTLVMWEAQFGDFVNGAQIMIDQFIATAETKWGQPSGLVLLLPHGYEGQGPEHSSARIERFLQLCAENNMQIVNCSTPAQYFHVLRRQMHGGADRRGVRKPLVIFTPKRGLRHAKAVSTLEDLTHGGFREALPDAAELGALQVRRVAICSGQIYYDLAGAREERKLDHEAILRLEQIYPIPDADLKEMISGYAATTEIAWVQEEPKNMGAWRFIEEQLRPFLSESGRELRYIGRQFSASTSAGQLKRHQQEQAQIVDEALSEGTAAKAKVRGAVRRKNR